MKRYLDYGNPPCASPKSAVPTVARSVHRRVRAKTKTEAEQVGKYMIRPFLSLERLSLDER
ncbi:MAG: hypothetical protein ACUVR0_06780 [Candidatus Aminicenantales bacterium]